MKICIFFFKFSHSPPPTMGYRLNTRISFSSDSSLPFSAFLSMHLIATVEPDWRH